MQMDGGVAAWARNRVRDYAAVSRACRCGRSCVGTATRQSSLADRWFAATDPTQPYFAWVAMPVRATWTTLRICALLRRAFLVTNLSAMSVTKLTVVIVSPPPPPPTARARVAVSLCPRLALNTAALFDPNGEAEPAEGEARSQREAAGTVAAQLRQVPARE